jgi:ectoine hydroxylase-related dioxygenase (phytanoyl-CoA dioxygenase family)
MREKEYWNRISFRGERGQIVLFPGYLPHQVLSNESNEERISLSFNIILDWNK